ncbi:type IVB secretion system protein IcmH/DotU [Pseudoxanthomonas putridarboris]|uniref:Type IVB secretion system protein IcmH/DotU n=1 Tax=Pseudoxanthomonas putridarboris TaxID=752605 RepID=A0ABU9J3A7_9GAMM
MNGIDASGAAPDDATVVRPRSGEVPPSVAAETRPPPHATAGEDFGALPEGGTNPLVRAASPLLLLATQLRQSAAAPRDPQQLREQAVAHLRSFEGQARAARLDAQTIMAARYVLCTLVDEAVLNAPWGERTGWAQKTLLVAFHGEAYGGEKFFDILDRLCADFPRHVDLIEMMYLCLALGFGGRYLVEPGGTARLADRQEDLYRRIKAQRGADAQALAPHWRGIEDRRNRLARHVPLWMVALAAACALLVAFLYFSARLNALSSPVSARLARIGLENLAPPRMNIAPAPAKLRLKQLLRQEEQAGLLSVDETADGQATVRIAAAEMFPSGGVEVAPAQALLLQRIALALDRVQGRVVVVGHTDDQPVRSLKFKDNYALSSERARNVAQLLGRGLADPRRLEASGAGDSQPVATPPALPANRARNRRVEIMLIPEA